MQKQHLRWTYILDIFCPRIVRKLILLTGGLAWAMWCLHVSWTIDLNNLMQTHDGVIKWKYFSRYWPIWVNPSVTGGFPSKISDAELWCFHWSASEHTVEQSIETPLILDAIALIMASLQYAPSYTQEIWTHLALCCVWSGLVPVDFYPFFMVSSLAHRGPVLLTLLRHVARILANGRAAFFESCDAIGWNSCDVSQKR